MVFILFSGIYIISWVRTKVKWHTTPCMNQPMIIYMRLLEDILIDVSISTLMLRKLFQGIRHRNLVVIFRSKLMWMLNMQET